MQRSALGVAVALLLGLAGCTQSSPGDPAPAEPDAGLCPAPATPGAEPGDASAVPLPVREGFEATSPGSVPFGWHATDGRWGVEANASASEGSRVLRGHGDPDPGFSSLLIPSAGDLADFTMEVTFRMGCIEHPHGVGVVLHVTGPDDYQILRYSATESAWDLFTVNGGVRVRLDEAAVRPGTIPGFEDVVRLRVTSEGGRVQAFHGDQQVVDHRLATGDAAAGQVGLFLRGNADAWFDEVRVDGGRPLPVA